MTRKFYWIAVSILLGSGTILLSQSNEGPKSEEYLLLGSANRGAGEPVVFVNPKDPDNIIVVAMATLNRLPSGEAPIPRGPTPEGGRNAAGVQLRIKELVGLPVPRLAGFMASFSGVSSSGAKNTPETFFEVSWRHSDSTSSRSCAESARDFPHSRAW